MSLVVRQDSTPPRTRKPPHCRTCGEPKKGHPVRCPLLTNPSAHTPPATITVKLDYAYAGQRIEVSGDEYPAYESASAAPVTPTHRRRSASYRQTRSPPTPVNLSPDSRSRPHNHRDQAGNGNQRLNDRRSRETRRRYNSQGQRRRSSTLVLDSSDETDVEVSPPLSRRSQNRLYSRRPSEPRRAHARARDSLSGTSPRATHRAGHGTYNARFRAVAAYRNSSANGVGWEQSARPGGSYTAVGFTAVEQRYQVATRADNSLGDYGWVMLGIVCVLGVVIGLSQWRALIVERNVNLTPQYHP